MVGRTAIARVTPCLLLLVEPALLSAAPGDAAVLPDRVRILYEAPPSCPDRSALLARVTERVTIAWQADDTELARQIRITLESASAAGGTVARMEYVDETGRQVMRSVNADSCEQALSGIALVTALAIESQAVRPGPAPDKANAAVVAPGNTKQETASNSEASSAATTKLASSSAPWTEIVPKPPEKPADRLPWIQEAGIRMGGTRGIGPGTALGAAAFWGIGHAPLPLLRVAASWYDYQSLSAGAAAPTAHFSLFAAEPQICKSVTLAQGLTFSGAGCAGVELGWYTAKGVIPTGAPFTTHSYGHSWASVLLSVPLRFERSGIFFELAPEFRVPLVRDSFEFHIPSSQPVFTIPRLAFGGVIASGLTFR